MLEAVFVALQDYLEENCQLGSVSSFQNAHTVILDRGRLFGIFVSYMLFAECILGKPREETNAYGRAFYAVLGGWVIVM